jgi:hypothetical protein
MAKERTRRPVVTAELPAIAGTEVVAGPRDGIKKARKRGPHQHRQLTLWITGELAFRLDGLATLLRIPKTALAGRLLDQGLAKYDADKAMRQVYAEICGQTGQSEGEAAA